MRLAIIAALISSAHGSVARTCSPQPACSSGVRDTAYCEKINSSSVCAAASSCATYNEGYPSQKSNVALLAFAMTMAVGMCFCIGGNDSANSWGSTVGSGALGIRSAVVLGGFAEWLGATLLGYGVSGTIRKGVADTDDPECWACGYCDSAMPVYQLGMLAALIGATFFLLLATFAKVPVSTTHAIVGGVVGMTMVGAKGGAGCLNWKWKGGLTSIIASWVISPVLSGAIGAGVYAATSRLTTRSRSPLRHALRLLPVLYSLSTTVMVLLILMKSKPTKHLDKATQVLPSLGCGLLAYLLVLGLVVPRVKREVEAYSGDGSELPQIKYSTGTVIASERGGAMAEQDGSAAAGIELSEVEGRAAAWPAAPQSSERLSADELERLRAVRVFRYLLVFVAFLGSFGHGANDTANSTAAFGAIYDGYVRGNFACASAGSGAADTPWWIMSLAGVCVAAGVITMGHRVIQTIGQDLTKLDYQLGFAIQLSANFTVVIATELGLPVSSTHCQVGSVVFVGALDSYFSAARGRTGGGVQWGMFGKIALSWILTLPFAGGLAAVLTVAFRAGLESA
eukprot:Transcript_8008.p1 GENE.Transcript_8008~~Transcript_8008.p1  ORF type:complete len:586 (+),score=207.71 Transcript_8008:57-1760(+)